MKLNDIILNEQPGNRENETFRKAPPVGDIEGEETTAQVAKELGVTPSRVRQMKMDGQLKTVKGPKEGRRDNFIRKSEVDAMKEKKKKRGQEQAKREQKEKNKG